MGEPLCIDDGLCVASQPERQQFAELRDGGFRTVINLRVDNEEDGMLRPFDEGDLVREAGMEYMNLPVSMKQLRPEQVDEFCHAVESLEGPILVHCKSGKRAAAFAAACAARRHGWSSSQTLDELQKRGITLEDSPLRAFIANYIDQHGGA